MGKYWRQQVEKVVQEETIYQQRHDREVQLRHQREQHRLRMEKERKEYGGKTRIELLVQLDNMVPQLVNRVNQQNSIRTQALLVSQHNQRKQLEFNSRQELERKMSMIDTIDKYPKSYNDALSTLNTLLYSRVPPTREYNFATKQNNATATTANQIRNRNKATAARRKTYDNNSSRRNSGLAIGNTTSTMTTVTRRKKRPASSSSLKRPRQEPQPQPQPLSLSQYQHQHQHQHQYQYPPQQLDPLSQFQQQYPSQQMDPLLHFQHQYSSLQLEPLSQFQHEYHP